MNYMWRVKQPYNVSTVAELAACAALGNQEYLKVCQIFELFYNSSHSLQHVKDLLINERERLFTELQRVEFLTPYPSQSNFILTKVNGDAENLKNYLAAKGIMVRYYSSPPQLASCIRISVGRPEHTDTLIAALRRYDMF